VAQSGSTVSGVAGRYATALFGLAKDGKAIDAVAADLGKLASALESSADLVRLTTSPTIKRAQTVTGITAVAKSMGLSDLTTRFLGVLGQNRRLADLPAAIRGFTALAAEHRGEATATVTSAHPLTEAQSAALNKKLKAGLGRDVFIDARVDPSLLGGLVVKVGSKMIDSSLKSKLEQLSLAMKG
jgi:F-type H+-transporting ATPase subunit delta